MAPSFVTPEELRALVGLSADAIIAADHEQRIVLFNRGAEVIFGYDRAEVMGKPLSVLIPERYRAQHEEDIRSFGDSGADARPMDERDGIVGLRKDGSEFPAEASIVTYAIEGERRYGLVLRDRSESERETLRAEQSEEVVRRLYEIAADPSRDLNHRLRELLELGTLQLGMETGVVSRICQKQYEVVEAYGAPGDIAAGTLLSLDHTYCSKTLEASEPVGFAQAKGSEWERHPCYEDTRLEAYLGAPIIVGGDTVGTLAFFSLTPRAEPFSEHEEELVRLMALWVGRELEAAERIAIGRLLSRGEEALAGSFDYKDIRGVVARMPLPTLADACVIYLKGQEDQVLRVEANVEREGAQETEADVKSLERNEGKPHPPLDVLHARNQAQMTLDAARSQDALESDASTWPGTLGYESSLVVPVVVKGEVLAALALMSRKPARYGPREWQAAREVATLAGYALAHGAMLHASTEAVKARERLLSFVSHDLGNPIATISMVAERLLSYPEDADQRRDTRFYLEGIREAVTRMERLVRDLLEVQVLEEGRRAIYVKEVPAGPLIGEAIRAFAPSAEAKSISLTGDSDVRFTMHGDRDRILEVFGNLLDNAIKFTPPRGSVTVGAKRRDEDVLFCVQDTGIGIGTKQIARLFDRYVQAREKRRAGAGLGLAIAKEIVEGHGGSIWCESELGAGATFYFTIPDG